MKYHQRASALLTALFVTAICAIIATAVIYKFRLMVHLAALNNESNQAYNNLSGLNYQAEADLEKYLSAWQHHAGQQAALTMPQGIKATKFNNTILGARFIDEQSLFNINLLASANNQAGFINLLHYLTPKLTRPQAITIANNITQWLNQNKQIDAWYARLHPPYRPGHQPMVDISELRMVEGITPTLFHHLKPYITALPINKGTNTAVNVNTAKIATLLTLSPKMTIQQAQNLYNCRRKHGIFLSINDFNTTCSKPMGLTNLANATTHSTYFLIDTIAHYHRQQVLLKTLITAQMNKKMHWHSYIIWQMIG